MLEVPVPPAAMAVLVEAVEAVLIMELLAPAEVVHIIAADPELMIQRIVVIIHQVGQEVKIQAAEVAARGTMQLRVMDLAEVE